MTRLLSMRDFSFSYDAGSASGWMLSIPDFSLSDGEIAVISGDNMSGKSTLLSVLAGLRSIEDCGGQVVGSLGAALTQTDLAAMSVILSADDKMFPELSVRENIAISNRSIPFAGLQSSMDKAKALLDRAGIFDDAVLARPLGSLSSGGRALVKLARACVADCPVIIVDEISSFLDDARAKFFLDSCIRLVRDGHCLVIVSHSQRDRQILLNEKASASFHISRTANSSILSRTEA
ncbi:ATP-binding cassette domain-containing protein [Sphingorhabdus sp.]|uniref:ABC transporter ATP-binding protein n=1 Tax=Sphingorhabdus sp. TaxID=1902408 RepID=UPI0032B875B7